MCRPLILAWGLLLAPLFGALGGGGGLTVKVNSNGGAPRIEVDGEPVRARMFWGEPGKERLPVSPEGRQISFDFTALASADNATIHFRFGKSAGEVFLDDVSLTDLTDNSALFHSDFTHGPAEFDVKWRFWPAGAENTVGATEVLPGIGNRGTDGLRVRLSEPPNGEWPNYHVFTDPNMHLVAGRKYRVHFWARADRARELEVSVYRPGDPFICLGHPDGVYQQQIQLAAGAGVNFVSFQINAPWPEPGKATEWTVTDARFNEVLAANPQALLVPRIILDPPAWWCRAHPEEVMRWEDGTHGDYAVPASPVYRADAAERLALLIRHLESKFGNHVAGYHPAGQNTAEWFYEETWKAPLSGFSLADVRGWHAWLQKHYGDDAALQEAWGQRKAFFETVDVPSAAARRGAPSGLLRTGREEQPLIDWADYQQEAMAQCVTSLAHAARLASKSRKLVIFFYGYLFEFGAVPNGPAVSGHYALRQVLDCPDIDVLCAPISYFDRGLGQAAPSMSAAESVALAGKMWFNEDDTNGFLAAGDVPGAADHLSTPETTAAVLTRNVAEASLRNFGTWWMDLTAAGWFNDARLWKQMSALSALEQPLLNYTIPFTPEVAAVIDERAMLHVAAGGDRLTRPRIYQVREPLGRMGAPYGQYLLSDLQAGRLHAKLYVLLNPWLLSPEQRAQITTAAQGSRIMWCDLSAPRLTSAALRKEAQEAGVHLFAQTDCNIYANGPYVALHAAQDGPLELHFPGDTMIRDVLSGETLGQGPTLTLQIKRGETRVLQY